MCWISYGNGSLHAVRDKDVIRAYLITSSAALLQLWLFNSPQQRQCIVEYIVEKTYPETKASYKGESVCDYYCDENVRKDK